MRDSVLEAYARQELPFDVLAARLAEEDDLDPASLIQVFFVLQNAFRRPLKLPDVSVRPFASPEGQPVTADRSHLAQGDRSRRPRRALPAHAATRTSCSRRTLCGIGSRTTRRSWPRRPQTPRRRSAGWPIVEHAVGRSRKPANKKCAARLREASCEPAGIQGIFGLIIFSIGLTFRRYQSPARHAVSQLRTVH